MNTAPTFRTSVLALLAIPALAFGLAACSLGGDTNAADQEGTPKTTGLQWDTANAKCLRDKGYDIPDPTADGGQAVGLDDSIDFETFTKDAEACTKSVTARLGKRPVSDKEKKAQAEYEKNAPKINACLREKGYEIDDSGQSAVTSDDGVNAPSADDYVECEKQVTGSK